MAMRYAADHPGGLSHLVLLDTAPALDEEAMTRVAAAMDRRQRQPWYDKVRREIDADEVPATDDQAIAGLLRILPMYFHRWDDVAQRFVDGLRTTSFHAPVGPSWNEEQGRTDLRTDIGRIDAPTLVVVGEDDFICDVTAARGMAQLIPGARLTVIPEAGHFPWVEQPAAFRAALDEFLTADS